MVSQSPCQSRPAIILKHIAGYKNIENNWYGGGKFFFLFTAVVGGFNPAGLDPNPFPNPARQS